MLRVHTRKPSKEVHPVLRRPHGQQSLVLHGLGRERSQHSVGAAHPTERDYRPFSFFSFSIIMAFLCSSFRFASWNFLSFSSSSLIFFSSSSTSRRLVATCVLVIADTELATMYDKEREGWPVRKKKKKKRIVIGSDDTEKSSTYRTSADTLKGNSVLISQHCFRFRIAVSHQPKKKKKGNKTVKVNHANREGNKIKRKEKKKKGRRKKKRSTNDRRCKVSVGYH